MVDTVIVEYGSGNPRSVERAIKKLGQDVVITNDVKVIDTAKNIILPGVGSFDHSMKNLRKSDLIPVISEKALDTRVNFLCICVGMQVLFEGSEEGDEAGLSIIPGYVRKLPETQGTRVPNVGWRRVVNIDTEKRASIINDEHEYYFTHSYHCVPSVAAHVHSLSFHSVEFVAAVAKDNVFGVQFHPEKSHKNGLNVLRNFIEK